MGDFFEGLSSFLPVAPGTFGEKPPEKRDENGQQPNSVPQQKQGRGGLDCTNGGLWDNMGDQKTLAERINAGAKFNKQDRDKQTELIAGGKGAIGDMNEAEPPKEPDPPDAGGSAQEHDDEAAGSDRGWRGGVRPVRALEEQVPHLCSTLLRAVQYG